MKITRYFQSCLLVEDGGARVLIDASGHDAVNYDKFGKLDAVIYTHEHMDHFDPDLAAKFMDAGVPVYANASTARQMEAVPNIVSDGQEFSAGSLKIKATELPHCLMVDGSTSVQNTGYLVGGRLFHPGDGKELAGLQAEILAVPISGPDISLKDSYDFVKQAGAKFAIPIHYDFIGVKPEIFAMFTKNYDLGAEVKILEPGQSVEL